jgi:Tim44-like domain
MRRLALILMLLCAVAAQARIGGGDSYSGDSSSSSPSSDSSSGYSSGSGSSDYGSSSSSGGGGGGGSTSVSGGWITLVFMVFIFLSGAFTSKKTPASVISVSPASRTAAGPVSLAGLREHDPNFSQVVFTDFCYSLFARVHEARGRGRLDDFAPYLDRNVRAELAEDSPQGLTSVDAIVIGAFTVKAVRDGDAANVEVDVEFDANYSETAANGTYRCYVRERWMLTRAKELLSPRPEKAKAEHCPKCGAALETRTDGACLHCGAVVSDGSFNWFVRQIDVIRKDEKSPQLGGPAGPEPGLDRQTAYQPWIARNMKTFAEKHPGFTWDGFEQRVREVAVELQNAWTARDWRRARPLETDALFQTHRYWIDEYTRQGLQNIVDSYSIDNVDVVKVVSDAFFDAITVRLYASGNDYTVDENGSIVGGSMTVHKKWSEYWTFVRGRGGAPADANVCPNCGGKLAEGQTAVCEYCGGKVRTGEFPWVLSRIEQDEAYL